MKTFQDIESIKNLNNLNLDQWVIDNVVILIAEAYLQGVNDTIDKFNNSK